MLLPTELKYQICFQLSIKDIREFLLSHKTNIVINWKDYFLYHTGIDEQVNKKFMIEHGRYLINKPIKIIKQYLKIYPELFALNLTDENLVCNKTRCVYFSREAKPRIRLTFAKCHRVSDRREYIKYQREIQEHGESDYYIDKTDLLPSIYDEIKFILLNDKLKHVTIARTDNRNIYIKIYFT